jgi:tellurite resistance protein
MHLDRAQKLKLLEFVCSFAWTDLKVQQPERDMVMRIAGQLGLDDAGVQQVQGWLASPPPAEEVDPTRIPREHRQLFMDAALAVAQADGKIVPAERDQLALFRDLLES